MKKRYYIYALIVALVMVWQYYDKSSSKEQWTESDVKIALREVGDYLLRENKDTTSLVQPVRQIDESIYRLSFESFLTFDPGQLVSAVDRSFERAEIMDDYQVEVLQCTDEEVAYSYEMNKGLERTLVACEGRVLPLACYSIEASFINAAKASGMPSWVYILLLVASLIIIEFFFFRRQAGQLATASGSFTTVGSFQFYPNQNKLVKQAEEISLSRKECELLEIFVSRPNEVIKREELTKKVWEDNGVVVGRSLDTYVSKLRKKLQQDESIKLTNVHGVGYKLELQ